MFDDIKHTATDRLLKVKLYLNEIPDQAPLPSVAPNEFANTLKGLFFVYLYGVFEMVITKTVARTIEELNTSGARISECKIELSALIFSPEYDALYGVGDKKKWDRRWDISNKYIADCPLNIIETILPTDGRNIQEGQLRSIANTFGNDYSIFPRPETRGYVVELVQFRNFIAHGDELPQDIGKRFSIADLEMRLQHIDELCTYTIDHYEDYIQNQKYLKKPLETDS